MPVAIYARISSDRLGDAANVQIQVTECLKLVQERGLSLVLNPDPSSDRGAYVDNNVSVGKTGSVRPEWDEVRRLARDGAIDAIVAWAPDRLYRLAEEQARFAAEMRHKGIRLHFATSPDADLTTPTGIFHAGLNALMAQHENDLKQARIVAKKKAQATAGEWNGGRAPLGYMAVPSDPNQPRSKYKLVEQPVVADALRTAVSDYLSRKYSLTECLIHFRKATGLDTAYSSWKYSLVGPSITGRRMHISQLKRAGVSTYKVYMHPYWLENNAVFSDAQWPGLISVADWTELRNRIVNSKKPRQTKPTKSLLGGLVFCASCGSKMGCDGSSDKPMPSGKKRYPAYGCKVGNGGCGTMGISAKQLEELVVRSYKFMVEDGLRRNVFEPVVLNKAGIMELENEIASLDEELRRARRLLTKGTLEEHEYEETKTQVNADKTALRRSIQRLNSEYVTETKLYSATELWGGFTVHQQRDALSLLIDRIEISKAPASHKGRHHLNTDRVNIVWKRTSSAIGIAPKVSKLVAAKTA